MVILQPGLLAVQWTTMYLVVFRCAISVEFIVNTKDAGGEKKELGDQRTVASGNLVLVGQY